MSSYRTRGFTLTELMVVIGAMAGLAAFLFVLNKSNRGPARRTACKSNLSQIGKACGMYAEVPSNLGLFPDYGDGNPMSAMNLLYDGYIDDPRVFSCPSRQISTLGLNRATDPGFVSNLGDQNGKPGCSYGYDPGHTDTHGMAGIAADVSEGRSPTKKSNSRNHMGHGQNLLIGAGSVEWMDDGIRDLGGDGSDIIWREDPMLDADLDSNITQK